MSGQWRSWALTDVGTVRTNNEDSYVARPEIGLWMVADGAGGHEHGELASRMLASALAAPSGLAGSDLIAEIRASVARTHRELRARAEAESAGSGVGVTIASTIVVFLASGAHYACLWAGDSRIYRLRNGVLALLTRDHSLVQVLVDEGAITEAEAERHPHANVITRAIGADGPEPELDKVTDRAEPGDRFLLCSDGLNKVLQEQVIARLIATDDPAQRLIDAALEYGARDNVTAIVVEYAPTDDEQTLLRRA
ncbi:MAG TPA: protein phosphatase 2C domain-containing protein [Acetobacteraceae bacterium]|nr:protein phosphatase 2C domain-containing protein [Acetobacteraceae bacterium]